MLADRSLPSYFPQESQLKVEARVTACLEESLLLSIPNFRGIGGIGATNRQILKGQIYRSASMASASTEDRQAFAELNTNIIFDLRSTVERERRPQAWLASIPCEVWVRDHSHSVGSIVDMITLPGMTPQGVVEAMCDIYRQLPYEQSPAYAAILRMVADRRLPMVIHCSAGKDRTGVIVAILLTLVGVSRAQIFDDYLATNDAFDKLSRHIMNGAVGARLLGAGRQLWEPMLRADRRYLEAMFAEVERRHGSMEVYAREALEFDDVAALRAALLHPIAP
jgi:protein-tyrosine phosphatase